MGRSGSLLSLREVSRTCRTTAAQSTGSSLSAPRTPMFTTAGAKQGLQGHLHESLEVTASLPSAVLRGDETDRYLHRGHGAIMSALHATDGALYRGFCPTCLR